MRLALGLALAIAFALAGVAGPAAAKPSPPVAPAPSVDNVYWMVDCLIEAKDNDLPKVLSTVPGAKGSATPWVLAAIGECLVAEHPIPAAGFYPRGAVAERFLYRDFPAAGASPSRRPAAVFAPVSAKYLAGAEPYSVTSLVMLDAASCLVRAQPERTYGFFRLERDSAEERAEMLAMAPALSQCLTEGPPFKLTPAIFRAFLAEAAYRVAAGQPRVFEDPSS
ncbi:MAG TPA: hypothetical protein VEW26_08275 [Allosphingosinicella sp.]|nr:hypothetical protein [Allosphingosinicella sp.]